MKHLLFILLSAISCDLASASFYTDSIYALYQQESRMAFEHYYQFDDSKSAVQHFENAYNYLESLEKINNADSIVYDKIFCLTMLHKMHCYTSMYSQADKCLKNLINIYTQRLSDTLNLSFAHLLRDHATMLKDLEQYDQAILYFNRTLNLYEKMEEAKMHIEQDDTIDISMHLGEMYLEMGLYKLALPKIRNIYKTNHFNDLENYKKKKLYKYLGKIYWELNDLDNAEKYYEYAAIEETASYKPDIWSALGHICCERGNIKNAEEYLYLINPYPDSEDNDGFCDASSLLFHIGKSYLKEQNLEKADIFFARYVKDIRFYIFEALSFKNEKSRLDYWGKYYSTYIEPVLNFWYERNTIKSASYVYDILLFTKAQLLFQQQTFQEVIADNSTNKLLIYKLQSVREQIELCLNTNGAQLNRLLLQESYIENELHHNIWPLVNVRFKAIKHNTYLGVQEKLSSSESAIEFFSITTKRNTTLYNALLLRKNSTYPELIPLFEEQEVSALVNTTSENQTSFTYSFDGNGQTLQQLVWSKVLQYINPGETIYFAPSGLLHQLAIEALPYDAIHTMADMFNLVRLSSTREIVLNKAAAQHSTATLYGGIQYNMTGDELLAESELYATSDILTSRGIENDTINRGTVAYLKGAKEEVENINQILKDNNLSVQLFTSTTANEESFKAISGKHQNILHIATHGFYWADSTAKKKDYFSQRMLMMDDKTPTPPTIDPLNRCGLLFAGANTALSGHSADLPEGVQDGILTAKEISLLDLRDAGLVVLSACETGKGEITGEGVFGLQRAFKQAGVQTIIMSLWPVNDAATQLLMTEFYRNWITNHQSKREAFRNAQNTVRSQYEEPVYWAGFIMLD